MQETNETRMPLGTDRVLSVDDVSAIMGFCPRTSTLLIKESGHAFCVHRRWFILESNLRKYLEQMPEEASAR